MPTHAAMAVAFKPLMDGLRARGYARSEFTTLNVKRLSATTALASGAAVRYQADGQEPPNFHIKRDTSPLSSRVV